MYSIDVTQKNSPTQIHINNNCTVLLKLCSAVVDSFSQENQEHFSIAYA